VRVGGVHVPQISDLLPLREQVPEFVAQQIAMAMDPQPGTFPEGIPYRWWQNKQ
jgi:hypothetical protein